MRHFIPTILFALSIPALASAQPLMLATDDEPAPPAPPVRASAAPPPVTTPTPAPAPPSPPVAAPERHEDPPEPPQLWSGFSIWAEGMDLRSLELDLGNTEIEALGDVRIPSDWAGNTPLAAHITGGLQLHVGMRALGFIRGPELRIFLGGGSTSADSPYAPVPGSDSLEMRVLRSFVFRLETAFGFQAELGPVVPYVLGRAAVGGALVDVKVRDSRLGRLGTETAEAALLELGVEAGVGIRPDDEVEIDFAFRGTFVAQPSYGGSVTLTFRAE